MASCREHQHCPVGLFRRRLLQRSAVHSRRHQRAEAGWKICTKRSGVRGGVALCHVWNGVVEACRMCGGGLAPTRSHVFALIALRPASCRLSATHALAIFPSELLKHIQLRNFSAGSHSINAT